jgi:hypothetical protein
MKNIQSEIEDDFYQKLVKKHPSSFNGEDIPEFYWYCKKYDIWLGLEFKKANNDKWYIRVNEIEGLELRHRLQLSYGLERLVGNMWQDFEDAGNYEGVIDGFKIRARAYRIKTNEI